MGNCCSYSDDAFDDERERCFRRVDMGGACSCCFGSRDEDASDPILNSQARARAAEAAEARQAAYDNSAQGRAAKKSAEKAEREKRSGAAGRGALWSKLPPPSPAKMHHFPSHLMIRYRRRWRTRYSLGLASEFIVSAISHLHTAKHVPRGAQAQLLVEPITLFSRQLLSVAHRSSTFEVCSLTR